jgi:tRNA(Ile2) C34 agmatinyltransferase TiaS
MPPSEPPAAEPAATKPPRCAMCRARMEIAHSEPGPNGSTRYAFKCPKCGYAKTKTVGDPLDLGRHRPKQARTLARK